jgi:hypothetical protein
VQRPRGRRGPAVLKSGEEAGVAMERGKGKNEERPKDGDGS